MKKMLFIAALFIYTIGYTQDTASLGVFEFESETIDYGTIKQNSDGYRVFTFKNTGNTPIIISSVKGSCGCTVATKPSKAILPGDSGKIGINYATNRIGGFSKNVTITSNANEKRKVVRIKGIVLNENTVSKIH